ncbi:tRNA 2-selenouridine(34) synthase MnmH [Pusillimonas sp. TS35]|nr:tRNA 2-selenouridine(34) synthase MnmH [Pusillimonas sp. TS35]
MIQDTRADTYEETRDYQALFVNDIPLLDVRAPVEFIKGAFPCATNMPLMNDEERQAVGIRYKRQGQEAAIELGYQLVSGPLREARIQAWANFARQHPHGYLYCFRGGLRSRITQQWLNEAGITYPRVAGGYKAMRNYLINELDRAVAECDLTLLGGLTGTGKTELLVQLPHAIDLEGHAHHRGSSFGKHATPQPAQIDFENRIAIDLIKKRARGMRQFILEEEGRMVGSCCLPEPLRLAMQQHSIVWLEDSLDNRVQRILKDYVIDLAAEFTALHGPDAGLAAFAAQLRQSLANITRRLGAQRYAELAALMDEALVVQLRTGDVALHTQWIHHLLNDYYDPMYAYQRDSKGERIVFRGDRDAVMAYLLERQGR